MPINLEQERKPLPPVVKRTAIGQVFYGAVVLVNQRNRLKKDERTGELTPIMKGNGKAKQELVITCLTLPGTTAPVGLGEDEHVAEEGELVRLILKGKSFGDWIETKRTLGRPVQVGDIVSQKTDRAQVYDAHGNASGAELTSQAEVNAVPRGRSVGIYGPIELRAPKDGSDWIAKAEEAYHQVNKPEPISAETASVTQDSYEEPSEPPYDPDLDEPPF